ncbi:MAG: zinc ribbon domain-containing protein [Nitrososphaerales archaeon]
MTRPIILLARLNEADLAVDATRARLAEIAEALREPATLVTARETLAAAEKEVERLRGEQAEMEREQAEAEQQIKRIEQKLYGGKVTAPRELEASQRDLAQHKNQMAAVEDRVLEIMVALEAATTAFEKARAEVTKLSGEWDARRASLRSELAKLKARLPDEQARAAAARQAIPAQYLRTYDHLRPRHGGRAVAELDGDECSACLVQAPPSKLDAARYSEELVYCGNCGRLLWGE